MSQTELFVCVFIFSLLMILVLTSERRGAYCAAVIVSLLNLPMDLKPESPAWTSDHPTLFTKLADYVQRCMYLPSISKVFLPLGKAAPNPPPPPQAKPSKEEYRLTRTLRHMVHMRSAR